MNINIEASRYQIDDISKKEIINKLYNLCINESLSGNKVAFYYENINNQDTVCFNKDVCFYAASTIKVLVCLMLFEKADKGFINLDDKLLVTMDDLKFGTGIINSQKEDTEYSIRRLIELTIVESDNTAYLKLVQLIGKDNIAKYGKNIGAIHTMEGKKTDCFGIINCIDMRIYWQKIKEYIDSNTENSIVFKNYLLNPSVKLIKNKSINSKPFIRKYGSWDIAYHEAGYVEDEKPYFLIVLTQLNKLDYKEEFVNKIASLITEMHSK